MRIDFNIIELMPHRIAHPPHVAHMSKTLCKLKKSKRPSRELTLIQCAEPTHICSKCGRVADSKKKLCKAKRLAALAST